LIDITVSRIAMPGMAHTHQAERIAVRPAPMMKPQLITLGSERPRNDRLDSIRIAVATISDAVTMIDDNVFGRMWRRMIRALLMPIETQASTNSRSRIARKSPRTRRAIGGQDTTAMAMITLRMDGVSTASSRIANRKNGIVWKISVRRMSHASMRPP
jgi:hypothetical protein